MGYSNFPQGDTRKVWPDAKPNLINLKGLKGRRREAELLSSRGSLRNDLLL